MVGASAPLHEAGVREGPQVAVDGRDRDRELCRELVGPGPGALGHDPEDPEPAGERAVVAVVAGSVDVITLNSVATIAALISSINSTMVVLLAVEAAVTVTSPR